MTPPATRDARRAPPVPVGPPAHGGAARAAARRTSASALAAAVLLSAAPTLAAQTVAIVSPAAAAQPPNQALAAVQSAAAVHGAAMSLGTGDLGEAAADAASGESPPSLLAPRPLLTLSATRAQPSLRLRGVESDDVQGVSYRWWLGSGRAALGFGFGTIGYAVPAAGEGAATQAAAMGQAATTVLVGSVPTASLGLRVALGANTLAYADGWRVRGLSGDPREVLYNAKAGIEWKPATSRWGFEGQRFGVQLDSGYRMSFRTRNGGLTVYLRRKF